MNMEINTHSQNDNQGLLFDLPSIKSKAYNKRNDPMFLRNQFPGMGKFGICKIKKQEINLDNIGLIACTNTKKNDKEYFDFGVHFLLMTIILKKYMQILKNHILSIHNMNFV